MTGMNFMVTLELNEQRCGFYMLEWIRACCGKSNPFKERYMIKAAACASPLRYAFFPGSEKGSVPILERDLASEY